MATRNHAIHWSSVRTPVILTEEEKRSNLELYVKKLAEWQDQLQNLKDQESTLGSVPLCTDEMRNVRVDALRHLQMYATSLASGDGLKDTELFDDDALDNLATILADSKMPYETRDLLVSTVDLLLPKMQGYDYPTFQMLCDAKIVLKTQREMAREDAETAMVQYQNRSDSLLGEGKMMNGECTDPVGSADLESLLEIAKSVEEVELNLKARLSTLKHAVGFFDHNGKHVGYF